MVWAVQPAGEDAAFVAMSGPGRVLYVRGGADPETIFAAEDETLVTSMIAEGPDTVVFGLSPEGTVKRATRMGTEVEIENLGSKVSEAGDLEMYVLDVASEELLGRTTVPIPAAYCARVSPSLWLRPRR